MSKEQEIDRALFHLGLLIGKVAGAAVPGDPVAFILSYRLDEQGAEQIMNEVGAIATEVQEGGKITSLDATKRILTAFPQGPGPSRSPEVFAADAVRAWAPEAWEKIKNS